jgi:hypothetical protein
VHKINLFEHQIVVRAKNHDMRIIRDALIGIALYEAVNYVLQKQRSIAVSNADEGSSDAVDYSRVASEEDFRPVEPFGESRSEDQRLSEGFATAANPEAPLTGTGSEDSDEDVWKNSLANDELRAPDS